MNRPKIKDIIVDDFTLNELHDWWMNNYRFFDYIKRLDDYIDHLETEMEELREN